MSLQSKLDAFKAQFVKKAPAQALDMMARSTLTLRESGVLASAIQVGQKVEDVTLSNQDQKPISLSEVTADGPVILSFFRGIWCPYCNIELEALNSALPEVAAQNAKLVAISPQTPQHSEKLKADKKLGFDILYDEANRFAERLGVAFTLPEELAAIYKQFGINLPSYNGDESWRLPMPTRLIVDETLTVRYAAIDPDYTVRPDPSETIASLRSLRQTA